MAEMTNRLHLVVDDETKATIDALTEQLDFKNKSELIRFAVRKLWKELLENSMRILFTRVMSHPDVKKMRLRANSIVDMFGCMNDATEDWKLVDLMQLAAVDKTNTAAFEPIVQATLTQWASRVSPVQSMVIVNGKQISPPYGRSGGQFPLLLSRYP